MAITRRGFVGYAAGAVTLALPLELWRSRGPARVVETNLRCVLLDLKEHCCLPESSSGYAYALASLGARWLRTEARSVPGCEALIVPAATEIPRPAVRVVLSCLEAGACVILESGAGFAAGPAFRAHRAVLRQHLGIRIEAPVGLWPTHSTSRGIPYVDYTWPHRAKLRDFSRVVPLEREAGDVIAWVDGLPVALKRRWGRGTLIFLGSPLGPSLWTGDHAAHRWLAEVLKIPPA